MFPFAGAVPHRSTMEFTGRDQGAAGDHHPFTDPPLHGDSMLVIRDALLSQLQQDRLRQDIIVAELAKIERDISLRSAASRHYGAASSSAAPTMERANQAALRFAAGQQALTPHGAGAVGAEHRQVCEDKAREVKIEDGVHGVVAQIKTEKPDMEDGPVRECFKSSVGDGKAPDQQKGASDDERKQESIQAVGAGHHQVCADKARDVKREDGLRGVEQIKTDKPDMEDHPVRECFKSSGTDGIGPDQQKNASDDERKQESIEALPPKKTSPSVKWSCDICQVEATSQGNLLQHFAGQKHLANVIAQKAKARAEKSRKACQHAEKPHPTWVCRFCPANCNGKSVLESHLKGKKHHAKIQALLEQCNSMSRHRSSGEVDSDPSMEPPNEGKSDSMFICVICQVRCTSPTVFDSHVRGKKHQTNFHALRLEAKRLGIIPPKTVKKQQASPEWDCTVCQAKCNSESQFHDHCRSMGHQQKIEALQRARSSGLDTGNRLSADGSNSDSASLEGQIQKILHFCKLCNLQCNSKNTLAEHRRGKKHLEKVEKRMVSSFCNICNLQCNSEKMLAHHCTGSKHQANVNGCSVEG